MDDQRRLLKRIIFLKMLPYRWGIRVCVEMARFHRVVTFNRSAVLSWTASGTTLAFHEMGVRTYECLAAFAALSDAILSEAP